MSIEMSDASSRPTNQLLFNHVCRAYDEPGSGEPDSEGGSQAWHICQPITLKELEVATGCLGAADRRRGRVQGVRQI